MNSPTLSGLIVLASVSVVMFLSVGMCMTLQGLLKGKLVKNALILHSSFQKALQK
jgi:hypothetical protein